MLSTLKVQQSRVLDVQFPAKDTVALLAHSAFKAELVAKLAAEGVQERGAFDPLSPAVLADPKFANETATSRTTIVRRLFAERIRRTCLCLPRHIGASVARHFGTATTSALCLGEEWWQEFVAASRPAKKTAPTTNNTTAPPTTVTSMFTDVDMVESDTNTTTNQQS